MRAAAVKEKSATAIARARVTGPPQSYLQTRIRASRLSEAAFILAIVELTRRLHQAYEQAYDKQAAEWLLPQKPYDVRKIIDEAKKRAEEKELHVTAAHEYRDCLAKSPVVQEFWSEAEHAWGKAYLESWDLEGMVIEGAVESGYHMEKYTRQQKSSGSP